MLHDSPTLMYCRHNQEKGSARCKRKQWHSWQKRTPTSFCCFFFFKSKQPFPHKTNYSCLELVKVGGGRRCLFQCSSPDDRWVQCFVTWGSKVSCIWWHKHCSVRRKQHRPCLCWKTQSREREVWERVSTEARKRRREHLGPSVWTCGLVCCMSVFQLAVCLSGSTQTPLCPLPLSPSLPLPLTRCGWR